VGAALLAANGAIFAGCNIENAAFSPTICAERAALARAVSEGVRTFQAVAVVTADGGSPCGVCRQVMFEFSPEMHVIIANAEGTVTLECSLIDLLPHGFRLSQAAGS
jgi:cytidine deaminase